MLPKKVRKWRVFYNPYCVHREISRSSSGFLRILFPDRNPRWLLTEVFVIGDGRRTVLLAMYTRGRILTESNGDVWLLKRYLFTEKFSDEKWAFRPGKPTFMTRKVCFFSWKCIFSAEKWGFRPKKPILWPKSRLFSAKNGTFAAFTLSIIKDSASTFCSYFRLRMYELHVAA